MTTWGELEYQEGPATMLYPRGVNVKSKVSPTAMVILIKFPMFSVPWCAAYVVVATARVKVAASAAAMRDVLM